MSSPTPTNNAAVAPSAVPFTSAVVGDDEDAAGSAASASAALLLPASSASAAGIGSAASADVAARGDIISCPLMRRRMWRLKKGPMAAYSGRVAAPPSLPPLLGCLLGGGGGRPSLLSGFGGGGRVGAPLPPSVPSVTLDDLPPVRRSNFASGVHTFALGSSDTLLLSKCKPRAACIPVLPRIARKPGGSGRLGAAISAAAAVCTGSGLAPSRSTHVLPPPPAPGGSTRAAPFASLVVRRSTTAASHASFAFLHRVISAAFLAASASFQSRAPYGFGHTPGGGGGGGRRGPDLWFVPHPQPRSTPPPPPHPML